MPSPTSAPTVNGRLAPLHLPHHQQHPRPLRTASSSYSPLLMTGTGRQSPSPGGSGSVTPTPQTSALHPGCVLCGLVASAGAQSNNGGSSVPASPMEPCLPLPSPVRSATPDLQRAGPSSQAYNGGLGSPAVSPVTARGPRPGMPPLLPQDNIVSGHRILYRDEDITVYPADEKQALCASGRHLIVVLNKHVTKVYDFGASDIPLLSHMINTAQRLLLDSPSASLSQAERPLTAKDFRIGFVNGMPADPRSPYSHLHAQAFLGPFDKTLPGSTFYRRNFVFAYHNWWNLEDLRAEIREETSNNRIKSGYDDRLDSPLDKVPDAGSVAGLPSALDPDAYVDDPGPPEISGAIGTTKRASLQPLVKTSPVASPTSLRMGGIGSARNSPRSSLSPRQSAEREHRPGFDRVGLSRTPVGFDRVSLTGTPPVGSPLGGSPTSLTSR